MSRRVALAQLVGSNRRVLRHVGLALVVVFAVILIGASPLALLLVDSKSVDWTRLSSIGQSYGAISAVLSAAAVGGVAVTLILQHEQAKDARRFAVREVHRDLLRMAIHDPSLAKAWGEFPARDVEDPRLVMYTNLVLNYLVLMYETDTAPIEEIRAHMRSVAGSDWMQQYWEQSASTWRLAFPGRRRKIVDLMDEEFKLALLARDEAAST